MKLAKTLLLGTAAGFAVVAGAQAADLPSRKAAPANYVKICDAYGAGFYTIPGTDTCLKVGGYVRAQWQYTPGKDTYAFNPLAAVATQQIPNQVGSAQDTTGTEVRGRVELDARTPTAMGTARTLVWLRAANTSGIRNTNQTNGGVYTQSPASATAITIERAMVQWAGFTFGVAPSNYAFMPGIMYHGINWAGFPNGIKQLAYTATFGGGFSATLAIEERNDWAGTFATVGPNNQYNHTPSTGYNITANIRVDQSWGWAILHATVGNNSLRSDYTTTGPVPANLAGHGSAFNNLFGNKTYGAWAIGATAKINLPMLAAGDALYLTANYTSGNLGAVMGGGTGGASGTFNAVSGPANHRMAGGILRIDSALVVTNGNCTVAVPCTIGTTSAWNVGGLLVHYWTPQWRSHLAAVYAEVNPPNVAATAGSPLQWGKGNLWQVAGSIIYSPVKDFDIGFELQYLNVKSAIQNANAVTTPNFIAAGSPGLKSNNWSAIFRVERQF